MDEFQSSLPGLDLVAHEHPALERRAIVSRPSGARETGDSYDRRDW